MNRSIDPPEVLEVSDPEAGLTGWLAVDSVIDDHFCGGLRMLPDVSPQELSALARAMTWKHGFLGMPHGGAKSGIVCDENAPKEEKGRLLAAFGRKAEDLLRRRVYLPGSDMGTTDQDIRDMLGSLGIRVPRRALRGAKSGWYTSLTVLAAAKAAAAARGFDLANATAAIEGFGEVGSSVAQELGRLGTKVVAVSTRTGAIHSPDGLDVARLLDSARRHGSNVVDSYQGAVKLNRESLLELDVDLLLPCARHHSIHAGNVTKIKARVISPGANVPATEDAERILAERGILCLPDFVANSGGVLGGTMEFAGLSRSAIIAFTQEVFSRQVSCLIEKSRKEGTPIRELAEDLAGERFARMQAASGNRSIRKRAFSLALEFYRNGMIPRFFVGPPARRYFQRRIEGSF